MLDIEGLQLRAALFHSIRNFFCQQGFLEVDTPIRQPLVLPESNIEPIPSGSWFLQTSPEQCMKRLLAAGCEKIFQICPCFRAEERGSRHLEEFTMLEWYRLDGTYIDLMEDCRSLIRSILDTLNRQPEFQQILAGSWFGNVDIGREWQKISVSEAFDAWGPISIREALDSDQFDEIISIEIEPRLGVEMPTFLYDYPVECASLALLKDDDASVAERFELYINGIELANGFSELTDSDEQRQRFAEELEMIAQKRSETYQTRNVPEKFLADLDRIDRAAGIAFGLDRFLMLLLSTETIDEVISFSPDDWD